MKKAFLVECMDMRCVGHIKSSNCVRSVKPVTISSKPVSRASCGARLTTIIARTVRKVTKTVAAKMMPFVHAKRYFPVR